MSPGHRLDGRSGGALKLEPGSRRPADGVALTLVLSLLQPDHRVFGDTAVEEIPEPEDVSWAKAGTPSAPKRLPGFNSLAWLALVAATACLQLLRSAADRARVAGKPWGGTALDTLAAFGAVGLAVAAVAVVLRRGF